MCAWWWGLAVGCWVLGWVGGWRWLVPNVNRVGAPGKTQGFPGAVVGKKLRSSSS